jgi:hypothetical protein
MLMTSELVLFYKDDFCSVVFDPVNQSVITTRNGYPNDEKLKKSLNQSLACIQQYQCPNIISDIRQVKGTWTATNDWIANDWFPRAIKAGLKNIAYIYPPDVFGQFAIQDLIKKTPHYTSQVFKDPTDAKTWINSLA